MNYNSDDADYILRQYNLNRAQRKQVHESIDARFCELDADKNGILEGDEIPDSMKKSVWGDGFNSENTDGFTRSEEEKPSEESITKEEFYEKVIGEEAYNVYSKNMKKPNKTNYLLTSVNTRSTRNVITYHLNEYLNTTEFDNSTKAFINEVLLGNNELYHDISKLIRKNLAPGNVIELIGIYKNSFTKENMSKEDKIRATKDIFKYAINDTDNAKDILKIFQGQSDTMNKLTPILNAKGIDSAKVIKIILQNKDIAINLANEIIDFYQSCPESFNSCIEQIINMDIKDAAGFINHFKQACESCTSEDMSTEDKVSIGLDLISYMSENLENLQSVVNMFQDNELAQRFSKFSIENPQKSSKIIPILMQSEYREGAKTALNTLIKCRDENSEMFEKILDKASENKRPIAEFIDASQKIYKLASSDDMSPEERERIITESIEYAANHIETVDNIVTELADKPEILTNIIDFAFENIEASDTIINKILNDFDIRPKEMDEVDSYAQDKNRQESDKTQINGLINDNIGHAKLVLDTLSSFKQEHPESFDKLLKKLEKYQGSILDMINEVQNFSTKLSSGSNDDSDKLDMSIDFVANHMDVLSSVNDILDDPEVINQIVEFANNNLNVSDETIKKILENPTMVKEILNAVVEFKEECPESFDNFIESVTNFDGSLLKFIEDTTKACKMCAQAGNSEERVKAGKEVLKFAVDHLESIDQVLKMLDNPDLINKFIEFANENTDISEEFIRKILSNKKQAGEIVQKLLEFKTNYPELVGEFMNEIMNYKGSPLEIENNVANIYKLCTQPNMSKDEEIKSRKEALHFAANHLDSLQDVVHALDDSPKLLNELIAFLNKNNTISDEMIKQIVARKGDIRGALDSLIDFQKDHKDAFDALIDNIGSFDGSIIDLVNQCDETLQAYDLIPKTKKEREKAVYNAITFSVNNIGKAHDIIETFNNDKGAVEKIIEFLNNNNSDAASIIKMLLEHRNMALKIIDAIDDFNEQHPGQLEGIIRAIEAYNGSPLEIIDVYNKTSGVLSNSDEMSQEEVKKTCDEVINYALEHFDSAKLIVERIDSPEVMDAVMEFLKENPSLNDNDVIKNIISDKDTVVTVMNIINKVKKETPQLFNFLINYIKTYPGSPIELVKDIENGSYKNLAKNALDYAYHNPGSALSAAGNGIGYAFKHPKKTLRYIKKIF